MFFIFYFFYAIFVIRWMAFFVPSLSFSLCISFGSSDMHTYARFFNVHLRLFVASCAYSHFKLGIQSDLVHWFHIDLCLDMLYVLSIACQKPTEQVFFSHMSFNLPFIGQFSWTALVFCLCAVCAYDHILYVLVFGVWNVCQFEIGNNKA